MNYDYLLSQTVWSFSRLKCYENCKYSFFLQYLDYPRPEKTEKFYTEYGKLMHGLIEKVTTGLMTADDAKKEFLISFPQINRRFIKPTTYNNYFVQAVECLSNLKKEDNILATEKQVNFKIGEYPFVGYIDAIVSDGGGYYIRDYKTRILKSTSTKKPRKAQEEFVQYAHQLYLYSIATKELYGEYPKKIQFFCYRDSSVAEEEFNPDRLTDSEEWAASTIEQIKREEAWSPSPDWFFCNQICALSESCEYAHLI